MPDSVITNVAGGPDLEAVRALFAEYGADVSRAHCLTGFDQELASLPGAYAPPQGGLLLLRCGAEAVGCVGLRLLEDGIAEMKRLYVRPEFQGKGFGRALASAAIELARGLGYRAVRLDTLGHMTEAQRLYRDLGFQNIPAYHEDTAPGMCFMELQF